jgi:uroporphyrinogen-III decarboxylase
MSTNASCRQRFTDTLKGRPTDRVPYFDFAFSARHVEAVLGPGRGRETNALDVEDYAAFAEAVGLDFLYYSWIWPVGRVYRQDSDGKSHYVNGSIKSAADFGQITPPVLDPALRRLEALSKAADRHGLALVLGVSPPYKLAKTAVGYEDYLIRTLDDQSFLLELDHRLADHNARAMDAFMAFPLDALVYPGDLCCNTGPMLSPESIRSLWLDSTRTFVAPFKARGIPTILHMDGDFSSILDLMMTVAPDALHPFEVCGALDIYKVKRQIGDRVTLIGNIDLGTTLSFGSPDEVRASVREHMERLAPGGRYMCGSSHEISEAVPVENFRALVEAVREFGAVTKAG